MSSPYTLAKRLLEVIPPIVQRVRTQARYTVKGNLTLPQFRILAHIKQGIATVGSIAESYGVTQPTMSKMIDGLVNRGFIKRMPDPKDRRQINLELTRKGEALHSQSMSALQSELSKLMSGLSPRERELLAKAFDHIESVLLERMR